MKPLQNIFLFYKNLLVNNRKWFIPIVAILIVGVISGVVLSVSNPQETKNILEGYASSLDTNLKDGLSLSFYIFFRNTNVMITTAFLGFFFGLAPLIVTFTNGLLLGVVLGFSLSYGVLNLWQISLLLIPHGVFEYAASFIALAFGLKVGLNWLRRKSKGKRKQIFVQDMRELVFVLPLVIGVLFLAALIEGNLTSRIACFLASACS